MTDFEIQELGLTVMAEDSLEFRTLCGSSNEYEVNDLFKPQSCFCKPRKVAKPSKAIQAPVLRSTRKVEKPILLKDRIADLMGSINVA